MHTLKCYKGYFFCPPHLPFTLKVVAFLPTSLVTWLIWNFSFLIKGTFALQLHCVLEALFPYRTIIRPFSARFIAQKPNRITLRRFTVLQASDVTSQPFPSSSKDGLLFCFLLFLFSTFLPTCSHSIFCMFTCCNLSQNGRGFCLGAETDPY